MLTCMHAGWSPSKACEEEVTRMIGLQLTNEKEFDQVKLILFEYKEYCTFNINREFKQDSDSDSDCDINYEV